MWLSLILEIAILIIIIFINGPGYLSNYQIDYRLIYYVIWRRSNIALMVVGNIFICILIQYINDKIIMNLYNHPIIQILEEEM